MASSNEARGRRQTGPWVEWCGEDEGRWRVGADREQGWGATSARQRTGLASMRAMMERTPSSRRTFSSSFERPRRHAGRARNLSRKLKISGGTFWFEGRFPDDSRREVEEVCLAAGVGWDGALA